MPPLKKPLTIVWFHRDLRLADHPALHAAAAQGSVLPVFLYNPAQEGPAAPGAASRWWLHHSLASLQADLREKELPLLIRKTDHAADTLIEIAEACGAMSVMWNRRYEPSLRERDDSVQKALEKKGLSVTTFQGDVLFEPASIFNQSGKPFQVFTPYWNHCLELPPPAAPRPAPSALKGPGEPGRGDSLESLGLLPKLSWADGFSTVWQPGESGARHRLKRFQAKALEDYPRTRDIPGTEGTSRLSPHLAFGEISPRQAYHACPGFIYRKEIGWRDFARYILFHFPQTVNEPLRPEFKRFAWLKSPHRRAWQEGRTGYPIVDAGMRQLWATGWMHNRVRMIVASFLVKDLLVSWKEGAEWFWDTLVDADLASNTFNWQWAGGCGADAAPYFRIFNPTTQGERFDPDGTYVRQWIPELATHPETYPAPVVEHAFARVRALEHFGRLKR